MSDHSLKTLLLAGSPEFWPRLAERTRSAMEFDEIFALSALRRKAHARQLACPGLVLKRLKIALLGGYSLYPFRELLEHLCEMEGFPCELWLGEYDNYLSEIMEETSGLYAFAPEVVLLIPSERRCGYQGSLADSRETQQAQARDVVDGLLGLVRQVHERTGAEILLTNFVLPARHDLGAYRVRTLGADWTFRKWVNLELGLDAPPYVHICDWEFLAYRRGLSAGDARAWFESKQPGSPALLADLAREAAHILGMLRRAPKKVLVLDLDNTLWGGVIADDGLEGIELGDTSARGEAFKAFQRYIASLRQRGILLAVCSKNDHAKAAEVFEKHPEMVLRLEDLVSFKANWEPKSDNIRQMAAELNLGLDSFVFVDDNPAEIEIVRQFAPEVTTVLLGPDASEYVAQLQDGRLFEPRNITSEDLERTQQYRSENQRQALLSAVTDMDTYLASLGMEGTMSEFRPIDVPRLAQLINKSNQFNLTTRRRTEADLHGLMADPAFVGFSMRLKDRFGDHGLISVVIVKKAGDSLEIDTWLMSCRVLKRQVEEEVLNEIARLGAALQCRQAKGWYFPTPKNEMVRDFYTRMGFTLVAEDETQREYTLDLSSFQQHPTKIAITQRTERPSLSPDTGLPATVH